MGKGSTLPVATKRLPEAALVLVSAFMAAWLIACLWPEPELNLSPVNDRAPFTHANPPSFERANR
jgi:hypothetical protein